MPTTDKIRGGKDFGKNFAGGGTFDAAKEITPSFDKSKGVVNITITEGDIDEYLATNDTVDGVFRVSFDVSLDPYAPYANARFAIQSSSDASVRAFVGFYETDTGGLVNLITIPLAGQTLAVLVKAINEYSTATAEVMNNNELLSVDCLLDSPVQPGTNEWAYFFKDSECLVYSASSDLKNKIKFFFTTVEPGLAQNNPNQSLGGFVSPTELYPSATLSQSVSFYDTSLVLSDNSLRDYSNVQIGDEIIKISEWQDETASVAERSSFGTPIRFHPAGSVVRGIGSNDIFNLTLSNSKSQYRCIAIKNTSETEIAQNMKVFFKLASRNILSETALAIEIPRSEYYEGEVASDSGSSQVLIDSSLASVYSDDHFVTAAITFTSGRNEGQTRVVSDYTGSTGGFDLDEELPYKPKSGDTFYVDTAPSQLIPNGIRSPSLTPGISPVAPYLITAFSDALFTENGISINIEGREGGNSLRSNEVVYVWLKRSIGAKSEAFSNNRAIISVQYKRS